MLVIIRHLISRKGEFFSFLIMLIAFASFRIVIICCDFFSVLNIFLIRASLCAHIFVLFLEESPHTVLALGPSDPEHRTARMGRSAGRGLGDPRPRSLQRLEQSVTWVCCGHNVTREEV